MPTRGPKALFQAVSGARRPKLASPYLVPAKASRPGRPPAPGFGPNGSKNEVRSFFSTDGLKRSQRMPMVLPSLLVAFHVSPAKNPRAQAFGLKEGRV